MKSSFDLDTSTILHDFILYNRIIEHSDPERDEATGKSIPRKFYSYDIIRLTISREGVYESYWEVFQEQLTLEQLQLNERSYDERCAGLNREQLNCVYDVICQSEDTIHSSGSEGNI